VTDSGTTPTTAKIAMAPVGLDMVVEDDDLTDAAHTSVEPVTAPRNARVHKDAVHSGPPTRDSSGHERERETAHARWAPCVSVAVGSGLCGCGK
jgi:hypothetical protein